MLAGLGQRMVDRVVRIDPRSSLERR